MKRFFSRNIDREGRVSRTWTGAVLALAAAAAFWFSFWAGLLLAFMALFAFVEAWRSWCFLRACGIKTKR